MKGKIKDQTGIISGKLTAVKFSGKYTKSGNAIWECICECGNTTLLASGHLTSKHVKSCGCAGSLPKGVSSFKRILRIYKKGAIKRKISWYLSDKNFTTLTKGNCHYCGQIPSMSIKADRANGEYIYNGIDRMNNLKAYTIKNCVSCCNQCNKAKAAIDYDDFIKWINKLITYNKTNF